MQRGFIPKRQSVPGKEEDKKKKKPNAWEERKRRVLRKGRLPLILSAEVGQFGELFRETQHAPHH